MRTLLFTFTLSLIICPGCGSIGVRAEKEMVPPPMPEKNLVPAPEPFEVEPAALPTEGPILKPVENEDAPPPPVDEKLRYAGQLRGEQEIIHWRLLLMVA